MSRRCCARDCFNTIITNKSVQYFGFPKSDEFARKWAINAGREDLLDKPLNNICKYYLCSSHFTDDCFTDASRTHLRKQSRPTVIVPIPTIFENNITEFIPEAVKGNVQITLCDDYPQAPQKRLKTEKEETFATKKIVMENENRTTPIHLYYKVDQTSVVDDFLLAETEKATLEGGGESQCRLCANEFQDNELYPIFDRTDVNNVIAENIERLMPETIFEEDGKPQNICTGCYERLSQCIETMDAFNLAQAKFDDS
ncbi:uncharacterized protein LOC134834892 [Culicoides brevitarsis]|uniref:uncharacterized protein LOC134834892 n=1 Tax=Culicoides brevitarsis TaxID=469753 RepID=UPI00307C6B0C